MRPTARAASGREGNLLLRRLLLVAFFLEVGLLLLVLPWSSFWETNYFAYAWPPLADILSNHYVRGGVSGLGLVNLIAGFVELAPVFALRDTSSGMAAPDDIDRPSPEPPDSTRGEARS